MNNSGGKTWVKKLQIRLHGSISFSVLAQIWIGVGTATGRPTSVSGCVPLFRVATTSDTILATLALGSYFLDYHALSPAFCTLFNFSQAKAHLKFAASLRMAPSMIMT